jgi:hypothetical protein
MRAFLTRSGDDVGRFPNATDEYEGIERARLISSQDGSEKTLTLIRRRHRDCVVLENRIHDVLCNCERCRCRRRWYIANVHNPFSVDEQKVIDQPAVNAESLRPHTGAARLEIGCCQLW